MRQPDQDPDFTRDISFLPAYSMHEHGYGIHNMELALSQVDLTPEYPQPPKEPTL